MNQKQRSHVEKRLLQERSRALEAMAQFDDRYKNTDGGDDGELSNYPLHLADEGTDTMEREKEFLLASQEGRRLYEIDDALRRLYREPESYGTCERCGREIGFERLDLVPWVKLCADCKRAEEESAAPEAVA
jgi:DnaK suppressor protein